VSRDSSGVARRSLPLGRIDCPYLITAWPSKGSPTPTEDEHRLLSETIMVLLRYPTLPSAVLEGQLGSQELPLPTSILQPGQLQSLGEFWQALGGKPKAALNYTVTIAVQPFEAVEVPLVTAADTELKPRSGDEEPYCGSGEAHPSCGLDRRGCARHGNAASHCRRAGGGRGGPTGFRGAAGGQGREPDLDAPARASRSRLQPGGRRLLLLRPAGRYRRNISAPEMGTRYDVVKVENLEVKPDPGKGRVPVAQADVELPPTRIHGSITDAVTGMPIPGERVRLQGDTVVVRTGDDGAYELGQQIAGEPTRQVTAPRYKPEARKLKLAAGQERVEDLALQPASEAT